MKKLSNTVAAIWVMNVLLLLAYCTNRPLYEALVQDGAQLFSCVDWDADGHAVPGVCETPAPQIHLPD